MQLHISDRWREALARAGLVDFDALMSCRAGLAMSSHKNGQTLRLELPGGRRVFLKKSRTLLKQVAWDLLHVREPRSPAARERESIERLSRLGMRVPEVIAWGQRRFRLGLEGFVLMGALPGAPLTEYLAGGARPAGRLTAFTQAGAVIARLYQAGLSWPDLRPKHVYVDQVGGVGLLDLERLGPGGRGARRLLNRQVARFREELRQAGAAEDDLSALMAAIGRVRVGRSRWAEFTAEAVGLSSRPKKPSGPA